MLVKRSSGLPSVNCTPYSHFDPRTNQAGNGPLEEGRELDPKLTLNQPDPKIVSALHQQKKGMN
jgi:hypothetical protein